MYMYRATLSTKVLVEVLYQWLIDSIMQKKDLWIPLFTQSK